MSSAAEAYANLPHKIRATALVGQFLQYWSVLESTINQAIEQGLKINYLQGAVLASNITFRNKIHILKVLVDLRGIDAERLKGYVDEVATLSYARNMVAHDVFWADEEGDGVKFAVAKAKNKLSFPDTRWSIQNFLEKFEQINDLVLKMQQVTTTVSKLSLADALLHYRPHEPTQEAVAQVHQESQDLPPK